ncbi:MAG: hypothetical protein H8E45_00755, partial [Proteobacteria bacterium]|nr:hypothetical protein [Pseudomonadota bacterium]
MPELPEVEVVRSSLEPLLVGRSITGVQLRCASLRRPVYPAPPPLLPGRRITPPPPPRQHLGPGPHPAPSRPPHLRAP